jgi:hypothetical protein
MNQQLQPEPTIEQPVNSNKQNISIEQAFVRVFTTEVEIWHILPPQVFNTLVKDFNKAHPKLQDAANGKQKIIRFINGKLQMRVCFKSKEAFMNQLNKTTYQAIQQAIKKRKL